MTDTTKNDSLKVAFERLDQSLSFGAPEMRGEHIMRCFEGVMAELRAVYERGKVDGAKPLDRELEQLKTVAGILGETFDQLQPQTDEGKRYKSLFEGTTAEFYDGPLEATGVALKRLSAVRAYVTNALDTSQRSREVSRALEHIFGLLNGEG
jgi:hypothetical protein